MKAQITYIVPVEVFVDTDAGTVERVVVCDEEAEVDRDDLAQDGKAIHDSGYDSITDQACRDKALKIAADEGWPDWEFGF